MFALLLKLFLFHSLLRLLDQRQQSLCFWFRWLEELFNFCSGKVIFNKLPDIKFFEPAVQDFKTGKSFLAGAAVGKTQIVSENPAVTFPVVKYAAHGFHHCDESLTGRPGLNCRPGPFLISANLRQVPCGLFTIGIAIGIGIGIGIAVDFITVVSIRPFPNCITTPSEFCQHRNNPVQESFCICVLCP